MGRPAKLCCDAGHTLESIIVVAGVSARLIGMNVRVFRFKDGVGSSSGRGEVIQCCVGEGNSNPD